MVLIQSLHAQNREIDSLNGAIALDKTDTGRVANMVSLSFAYTKVSDYDGALKAALKAQALSKKINFSRGEAEALSKLGNVYMETGEYDKSIAAYQDALSIALRLKDKKTIANYYNGLGGVHLVLSDFKKAAGYYHQSLQLREEIGDRYGMAVCYSNLGNIEGNEGNYAEALKFQLQSLNIKEALLSGGNKEITERSVSKSLSNIGLVYQLQGNYKQAIVYQLKALAINQKFDDKRAISESYNNIGNIYYNWKDQARALDYFEKCLRIKEEIGDRSGIAGVTNNIGVIYKDQENYDKALAYLKRSLALTEELGEKDGVANVYINMGTIYTKLKQYPLAKDYFVKAMEIGRELEILDDVKECCKGLSDVYKETGDFKNAYAYFNQYITYRDSLVNEENTKKMVRAEMNYEFEKKEAFSKLRHDNETAVAAAESKKHKVIIFSISGVLLLVCGFALFAYKNNVQKQKVNRELGIKNQKLEQAYITIEEKNKEVTDSIHYAKRIQRAMITSDSYISQFLEDYFVFYQPKDIVSGDFYWAVNHEGKFYMIIADCTGHGVPGAFMSLLNISFLNEIVIEKNILQPDRILNEQRKQIIKALNPTGTEESKDGMDCVLFALDLQNKVLEFAAANNSFYIIRDGAIMHCKADKMPVGKGEDDKPFTYNRIQLREGDVLYIFTDGYADQFGGPKGKKFKYKQFEEFLLAQAGTPLDGQPALLRKTLSEWKGDLEQVDDVLVMGFKI